MDSKSTKQFKNDVADLKKKEKHKSKKQKTSLIYVSVILKQG